MLDVETDIHIHIHICLHILWMESCIVRCWKVAGCTQHSFIVHSNNIRCPRAHPKGNGASSGYSRNTLLMCPDPSICWACLWARLQRSRSCLMTRMRTTIRFRLQQCPRFPEVWQTLTKSKWSRGLWPMLGLFVTVVFFWFVCSSQLTRWCVLNLDSKLTVFTQLPANIWRLNERSRMKMQLFTPLAHR